MQRDVAEIKQQGVIEAANDPKSSLTSEDARRKIVEESKKAGNAAFRFDPDATPEQKAAQVQNAIPDGFHRDQKPKGTAVATDIVKGPGEYDLPPPTKAMDADALTKAGVDTKSSGGSAVDDDKARWAKVGWEPRFGEGTVPRDEGDDPTEHQTWVEAHLDEKFFGDWYQNTAVIVFACLASWLVAQLGGGLAWVFIVMAICGTYYRTSLRRVRRNFRDDIRRDLAKAKLETDVESLEWINSFLVKFWPIFQPVLAATVISSVDQVLSTSTPAFLDSLRLTEFTLGSKPPRMEHVKTYPNSQDDIVLMDWKFSFTPNDKMDMTARQLKNREQPKVVLEIRIGKAMISKGLPVIVEDMAFSGLMRFKVKLQIPFPHVEKVEFCFLEKPKLDYVCKPLGGSTFGIDMNMVPGLEDFIQSQIHANLGPIMYAPNVFPIEVAKMLAGNPVDQALGVVAVTLHGAQGLKNNDKFAGTPDPYAILSLNSRTELARTKTVKENASPRWNETKHIIIASFADNLTFQVFDFNDVRKDKELGTASFALDALQANPEHPNQTLEVLSNGRSRGAVLADIHFFPVLEGRKLPDGKEEAPPESNTGIARFTIEQAKELDGTKSLVGALTPYAVLLLNNHEVHKSGKLKRTNNPIWADGSKEMLITDRKSARLGVVIKDDRDIAGDPILGAVQMKLDDMLEAMQKGQEWYNLAGAKTGRAKLTLQWKPVALKGALGGTGGYVTPIGCLRFHFGSAKDLRNLETMGKSDPYVRVLLSGVEKGKTVTFQNDLNPTWDEIMYVPIHSAREKLTVEVMDQESTGKDRSLGEISILASDYVKHDPDGEYLEHVERKQMREGLMMHGKGAARGILDFNVSFYPCMNVADPGEEPEKDKLDQSGASDVRTAVPKVVVTDDEKPKEVVDQEIPKHKAQQSVDQSTKDVLALAEKELVPATPSGPKKARLSPEELLKYQSGLLIIKVISVDLAQNNCFLEVRMDDNLFGSFQTSKIRTRKAQFDEIGDAMVRELDFSKINLRLKEKEDSRDEKEGHTLAQLSGDTAVVLKQCLNNPSTLSMRGSDGNENKVTISLKYIPIKMNIEARESISNMGTLRVDVVDGKDLPAADRSGFSDPYCKFEMNGKEIYKTQKIKKTLNPTWNENFEVQVPSRTAAKFICKVYDWDFGEKADFLGATVIDLSKLDPFQPSMRSFPLDGKSGAIRLKMLFRPDYVTRSRQGTSSLGSTFHAPSRVATSIVGAPIKGVGKGAAFIKHGFSRNKSGKGGEEGPDVEPMAAGMGVNGDQNLTPTPSTEAPNGSSIGNSDRDTSQTSAAPSVNGMGAVGAVAAAGLPGTPMASHSRIKSFGSRSATGSPDGRPSTSAADHGQASVTILSASGYPPGTKVMVLLKQVIPGKGTKDLHKTKDLKLDKTHEEVRWEHGETVKVGCTPDTQFQVVVKDHKTFGADDVLGEALYLLDESPVAAGPRSLRVGDGTVVLESSFTAAAAALNGDAGSITDSPKNRRSFLRKATPTPAAGSG